MKRTSALNDWGQIREAMGDRKLNGRNFILAGVVLAGAYGVMNAAAKKRTEPENIDAGNPYIKPGEAEKRPETVYEGKVKPVVDKLLSFGGLVVLSPLYGLLSLAVYLDDPGPVFFTQKRVGKDKHFFMLHKYRSMKMDTPHDVPTHQLSDPEQYITRVGRVLRKTSLDELPQIWDIFRGRMSIIGPRPALWNQEDLVKERDKYSANSVMPGLTGWAQINGRDELEIPEKAKLDGEYTAKLYQGGWKAFWNDVCCFLGTIDSVLKAKGLAEGGTGNEESLVGIADVDTIPVRKKKILITGANSYIGEAVKEYLHSHSEYYAVDVLDAVGLKPVPEMFIGYDTVFNVAGIAHAKESKENKHLYYEINKDLVVKIAFSAKKAGVGQFIILSSMSVYGILTGKIKKTTLPCPRTAYGRSKLEADEVIEGLSDERFKVAIIRPPIVYGNGCKGNYQILRSFTLKSPIFPQINNQRSMIYIGNLCEFVKRVIDSEAQGLFFPQNKEYVNTSEMVERVAVSNGKTIKTIKIFNIILKIIPLNIVKKVFGNLVYEKVDLVGKYSFDDSISLTESRIV